MTQVCSVYSQLLQLFPRGQFAQAVKRHRAEYNAKGFTCWEQFVAMLFCQVAHLNSLREVCLGLAGCESPLKHLGIGTTPKKSTLAYANAHRPWELYESVFMQLLERCQAEISAHSHGKFRFKNKLMSLRTAASLSCRPPCSTGQNTARGKARSNCICCWTMTATCPPLRW